VSDLLDFVWKALAAGSIGNAGYDALKTVLGNKLERLLGWRKANERARFDDALALLLDDNAQLQAQLKTLAGGGGTFAGNTNTGTITAGGNVQIGNNITHFGAAGEAALHAAEAAIPQQAQEAIRMAVAAAQGLPRVEAQGANLVEVSADGAVRIVKALAPDIPVPAAARKRDLG
jgi:hypothetical protein